MTGHVLLDTSTVILLPRLTGWPLPQKAAISSITLAELCAGPAVANDLVTAQRRAAEVTFAMARFGTIPFDVAAAQAYATVVGSLHRAGRKGAARRTDALIAAVALANDLPLVTCDPADFAGIEGLKVVVVPHPDVSRN